MQSGTLFKRFLIVASLLGVWLASMAVIGWASAAPAASLPPSGAALQAGGEARLWLADTGTVSGTVYAADGLTPLPQVNVDTDFMGLAPGGGACTDQDGHFLISGLPTDLNFRIVAGYNNHCGNLTLYTRQYWGGTPDPRQAILLNLPSGDPQQSNITFTLQLGGALSGTIYAADGMTPVPDVNVSTDFFGYGFGACTDQNGQYTITNVPLDTDFKLSAGGTTECGNPAFYVRTFLGNTPDWSASAPISVTSSLGNLVDLNINVQLGGTISGTVYAADGLTPIANMAVDVADGGMGVCTDQDGHYTLVFPFGTWKIRSGGYNFCPGGPTQYVTAFWPGVSTASLATPITLTVLTPTVGEVNFNLTTGGTISGTVYAADGLTPLPQINVDTDYMGLASGGGACTDQDGHFLISGLPTDLNFRIVAGYNNHCGNPTIYTRQYWGGTPDPGQAILLNLPGSDPQQSNITFTLELGGAVAGTAYAADGQTPLSNVNVDTDFFGYGFGTCTDQNGQYTITNVPLNTDFKISAGGGSGCGNPTGYMREFWRETPDWGQALALNLPGANPQQSNITFTLDIGGSITGRVVDALGQPLGGVPVDLGAGGAGRCTQPDGSFTLNSVPLNTPVTVRAAGIQWGGCPNQQYFQSYYPGVFFPSDAAQYTVTSLTPTLTLPDIHVTNLNDGGTISGTATNGDTHQPAPNAAIDLVELQAIGGYQYLGIGARTDPAGQYRIPVPYGAYRVLAGQIGNGPSTQEFWPGTPYPNLAGEVVVSSTHPAATGIDFTLYRATVVSGTVTEVGTGRPLTDTSVQFYFPFTGIGVCTDPYGHYSAVVPWLGVPFSMVSPSYVGRGPGWSNCNNTPFYQHQYWDHILSEPGAKETTLTMTLANRDDASWHTINFDLAPGGVITGRVLDTLGHPLEGIAVNLGPHVYERCTQPDGSYMIDGLPLDTPLTVMVAGQGNGCSNQNYVRAFYPNVFYEADATQYTLTLASPSLALPDIQVVNVNESSAITGTVTDGDLDQPLPDTPVRVAVVQAGGYGFAGAGVSTDAAGHYRLPVPPGVYRLTAGGPGSNTHTTEFWQGTGDPTQATPITVSEALSQVTAIDFTLYRPGVVSGTVTAAATGAPLGGIRIQFFFSTTSGLATCTNSDGTYALMIPWFGVPFTIVAEPEVAPNPGAWVQCAGNPAYANQDWQRSPADTGGTVMTMTLAHRDDPDWHAVDFQLVRLNPVPILTGLYPPSIPAGAPDLTLTLTGTDFVTGTTVLWEGAGLTTTFVSTTSLTALLPAAQVVNTGTFPVTAFSPAPGGGASNPVPVFVTPADVAATGQSLGVGTNPTATVSGGAPETPASTSVAAVGTGAVVVSQFSGNPGDAATFKVADAGTFFDVYVAPQSVFATLTITACHLAGGEKVMWDDGLGHWAEVRPQSAVVDGCITMTLSDTSSPTIAQLSGTVFGVVADQTPPEAIASATTANLAVYLAGTWTNQTVTVHFECSDAGSGVAACPSNQVFSAQGIFTATGVMTDVVGNHAPVSFGPILIDMTPPTLHVTVTPTVGTAVTPTLYLNQAATVSAGAADLGGSGLASQSCGALDTSTVGTRSVACTAADHASNTNQQTLIYRVVDRRLVFLPLVRR